MIRNPYNWEPNTLAKHYSVRELSRWMRELCQNDRGYRLKGKYSQRTLQHIGALYTAKLFVEANNSKTGEGDK